jgi:hypothetical protein
VLVILSIFDVLDFARQGFQNTRKITEKKQWYTQIISSLNLRNVTFQKLSFAVLHHLCPSLPLHRLAVKWESTFVILLHEQQLFTHSRAVIGGSNPSVYLIIQKKNITQRKKEYRRITSNWTLISYIQYNNKTYNCQKWFQCVFLLFARCGNTPRMLCALRSCRVRIPIVGGICVNK